MGWDGHYHIKNTEVQQDVFVWRIEVNNYLGSAKQLSEQVTLLK